MNKLELARMGLRIVASSGVYKVVSDVIKNNTAVAKVIDPTTAVSTVSSARTWVGKVVIGSIVSDVAMKHVNDKVDQAIEWYEERKSEAEKDKSETDDTKPSA